MGLTVGTRLGVYGVLGTLGAGGMGEVYRARDTRLQREVALKILPQAFAGDPDRLARFEREARVLASLNHPQIAAIYGVEDAGGSVSLVTELAAGQTLSDRLARGAMPMAEALRAARQIAAALEAAHDKGIVHRDLKPGNVMIDDEGRPGSPGPRSHLRDLCRRRAVSLPRGRSRARIAGRDPRRGRRARRACASGCWHREPTMSGGTGRSCRCGRGSREERE